MGSATGEENADFVMPVGYAGSGTRLGIVSRRAVGDPPLGATEVEMLLKAPSPIVLSVLHRWLSRYPVEEDARFLFEGFSFGFRLPISQSLVVISPGNLKSAREHPLVVRQKVESEVSLGRMSGLFDSSPNPDLCISPVGVVPKKVPGKFRLIQHLSFPFGGSVNDAIPAFSTSCSIRPLK